MKKIQLAVLGVVAGLSIQARATLFDITFSGSGISATGTITATDNGNGTFLGTSGTLNVVGGTMAGFYSLLAPNNYNIPPNSSLGHFAGGADLIYDNVVSYPSLPFFDYNGMAWITPSGLGGPGINIWGNSPTDYEFFGDGSSNGSNPQGLVDVHGIVTVTMVPVPEASTTIAGMLLLLPLGASAWRILRNRQAA